VRRQGAVRIATERDDDVGEAVAAAKVRRGAV
jgi:hypothetical protein